MVHYNYKILCILCPSYWFGEKTTKKCPFVVLSKKAQETTFLSTLRGSRNVAKRDDLIIVLSTLCFLHMPPLAIKYIMMQAVIDAAYIIRHVKKRLEYPAPSSFCHADFSSLFLYSSPTHIHTPQALKYISPATCTGASAAQPMGSLGIPPPPQGRLRLLLPLLLSRVPCSRPL